MPILGEFPSLSGPGKHGAIPLTPNSLLCRWTFVGKTWTLPRPALAYHRPCSVVTNRSLIESQVLSFRVRYARMMASGVLPRSRSGSPSRTPNAPSSSNSASSLPMRNAGTSKIVPSLGLSFDPYDYSVLPKRLIILGSAANFPSVVNLLADVFNAPVYAPLSDASVAVAGPRAKTAVGPNTGPAGSTTPGGSLTPTHTAGGLLAPGSTTSGTPALSSSTSSTMAPSTSDGTPSTGIALSAAAQTAAQAAHLPPGVVPAPSRASAALGSAYLACWAYRRKTRPDERFESFEEEVRTLLRAGAQGARAERKLSGVGAGAGAATSGYGGSHSGTTTPHARSGLGMPSPLLGRSGENEEGESEDAESTDEEDDHVLLPQQRPVPPSSSDDGRAKSVTPSTSATLGTFPSSGSTLVASSSAGGGLSSAYPSNASLFTSYSGGAYGSGSSPPSVSPTPSAGLVTASSTTSTPALTSSQAAPFTLPVSSSTATLTLAPLPSDEADIDAGLVKVADCDLDSFMMYAALVPEYCRLEGLLVRQLV